MRPMPKQAALRVRSRGCASASSASRWSIRSGSNTEEPIVTAAAREIKDVLGSKLGATLVESSDPRWQRDPDLEQMTTDFRGALAQLVPVFMPDLLFRLGPGRAASLQGICGRDRADRVCAGQSVRLGDDAADRLLRRAGGGAHLFSIEPRSRHHPAAGAREHVPLSYRAIPHASRRGLESARLHRNARRLAGAQRTIQVLGRRSARRLQELGRGRATRAMRWAGAKASTSASCCASCCAGST